MVQNLSATHRGTIVKLMPPPKHLEPTEANLFKQIVQEFSIDDAGAFSLLTTAMEAHMRSRHARERIAAEGEAILDRFKQLRAHPMIAVERDARGDFLRAMRALNLARPTE
jgi:phage terminase small subunit